MRENRNVKTKKQDLRALNLGTFRLDIFCGHDFVGNVRSYNHAL